MKRIVQWYWDSGRSWGEVLASTVLVGISAVLFIVRWVRGPGDGPGWLLAGIGLALLTAVAGVVTARLRRMEHRARLRRHDEEILRRPPSGKDEG